MNSMELLIKLASSDYPYADKDRRWNTAAYAAGGAIGIPLTVKAMDILHILKEKPTAKTYATAAILGAAMMGLKKYMEEPSGEDRVEWLKRVAEDRNGTK